MVESKDLNYLKESKYVYNPEIEANPNFSDLHNLYIMDQDQKLWITLD